MRRRPALALLGLGPLVLAGCGGDAPAPTPAPPVAGGGTSGGAPPMPVIRRDIALWGDSLVPAVAVALRDLAPGRGVFDGGVSGETSTRIDARQQADGPAHADWINVFWYGSNNQADTPRIFQDVAASVGRLPAGARYVVMALINQATPAESRGAPVYEGIVRLNRDLAATHGGRYLDIRSFLVSQFDPSRPEDVADHEADRIPASLRADVEHLNLDGSAVVARRLLAFIEALGW